MDRLLKGNPPTTTPATARLETPEKIKRSDAFFTTKHVRNSPRGKCQTVDLTFHYPPELFQLLIDALPRLCSPLERARREPCTMGLEGFQEWMKLVKMSRLLAGDQYTERPTDVQTKSSCCGSTLTFVDQ